MFTGIVETTAYLIKKTDDSLTVARPLSFNDIKEGSSIAVNGVCLSVVDFDKDTMRFDIVGETWRRTNLGSLIPGSMVNLERALAAAGRFEGHIVQGHIEGTANVIEWKQDGNWQMLVLELPLSATPFVTEKGSIALDGISLTVASLHGNQCTIALIPHTLEVTNMAKRKPGDAINVETDILAHYVFQRSYEKGN